jgi:hypothetical protein
MDLQTATTLIIGSLSVLTLLSGCPAAKSQAEGSAPPKSSHEKVASPVVTPAFTLMMVNPYVLEPIARYEPQQQRFVSALPVHGPDTEVNEEGDAEAMRKLIPFTTAYPVYVHGEKVQQFQPQRLDPPGCGDYPQVVGQLNPPVDENQSFQGLAYVPVRSLPTFQPSATPTLDAQTRMGALLKSAYFVQNKRSANEKHFELTSTRSFPFQKTANSSFELGLFITGRRKNTGQQAMCDQETFWVMGLWEQGKAVPLVSYQQPHRSEYAEDCQSSDLISSFGVNQALDHVLVRHNAYESWSYSIYAWQQDTWKEVFAGGGGGC